MPAGEDARDDRGEPGAGRGGARAGRRLDRGHVLVAAQLLCLACLLWPGPPRWDLPPALVVVAGGAVLAGAAVILLGGLGLGRELRPHPAPSAGATLRTHGLFGLVRHPIYSGVLLLAAGLAVLTRQVEPLVAVAALTGVLNVKAGYEERLLRARFGVGYEQYAARVPRFVPRVGRRRRR